MTVCSGFPLEQPAALFLRGKFAAMGRFYSVAIPQVLLIILRLPWTSSQMAVLTPLSRRKYDPCLSYRFVVVTLIIVSEHLLYLLDWNDEIPNRLHPQALLPAGYREVCSRKGFSWGGG